MKKYIIAAISIIIVALVSIGIYSLYMASHTIDSAEVISEFKQTFPLIAENAVHVDEIDITRRKTSLKNGTDSIFLSLTASNEQYTYHGSFIIDYRLSVSAWKRISVITESEFYTPRSGVPSSTYSADFSEYERFDVSAPIDRQLDLKNGTERITFTADMSAHTYSIAADLMLEYQWSSQNGTWILTDQAFSPRLYFGETGVKNSTSLSYTSGTKPDSVTRVNDNELMLDYDNVFPAWYFASNSHIIMYGGTEPYYQVFVNDTSKVSHTLDIESILSSGCIELNVYPGSGTEAFFMY